MKVVVECLMLITVTLIAAPQASFLQILQIMCICLLQTLSCNQSGTFAATCTSPAEEKSQSALRHWDQTTVFQSLVIQMHTQACLHGVYHSHVPWFLPRVPHIASQGAVHAHLPKSIKHCSIDARLHIR